MNSHSPWKWIVATILFLILGFITFVGMCSSTAYPNCWNGASSLRSLVAAQEDFRRKDADRNGIRDYWRKDG